MLGHGARGGEPAGCGTACTAGAAPAGRSLTVVSLELHFLFKLMLHVSLEMVSHFTGAFTGRLPWDS